MLFLFSITKLTATTAAAGGMIMTIVIKMISFHDNVHEDDDSEDGDHDVQDCGNEDNNDNVVHHYLLSCFNLRESLVFKCFHFLVSFFLLKAQLRRFFVFDNKLSMKGSDFDGCQFCNFIYFAEV